MGIPCSAGGLGQKVLKTQKDIFVIFKKIFLVLKMYERQRYKLFTMKQLSNYQLLFMIEEDSLILL